MIKDLIQRKKGLDQEIIIEKKDKTFIIRINKEIEVNEFLDFLFKKNNILLNLLNINLIIDKKQSLIKTGTVYIIIEKEKQYTLFFYNDGVEISEKIKKDNKENIFSWNSNNEYSFKKIIDTKSRKKVLVSLYDSLSDNSKEDMITAKNDIETLLKNLDLMGYHIPLELLLKELDNKISEIKTYQII